MNTPLNLAFRLLRRPATGLAILLASALLASSLGLASPLASANDGDVLRDDTGQIDISRPSGCPSACRVPALSSADPPVVLAGETVSVSVPIRPTCPNPKIWKHLVIALDPRPAISAREMDQVRESMRLLVTQLSLDTAAPAEIAIVQGGSQARVLSPAHAGCRTARTCDPALAF